MSGYLIVVREWGGDRCVLGGRRRGVIDNLVGRNTG